MAAAENDVERVALWLYDAATVCGMAAEVRAVLRAMMDQAIAGEGERGEDNQYPEESAPMLVSRLVAQWDEVARNIAADECDVPVPGAVPLAPANGYKRSPRPSLIETAIAAKGPSYSAASAVTFRSDAMAILEALVAEADGVKVAAALERQGFQASGSYMTTLRALTAVASSRRPAG